MLNKLLAIGGGLGAILILVYLNNRINVSGKSKLQPPLTLDQLTEKHSDICDKMITDALKKEPDLRYISGYFILTLDENSKNIQIKKQLYFQTKNGKWVEKTGTSSLPVNRLSVEDLEELRKTNEIKYEVDAPEVKQVASDK